MVSKLATGLIGSEIIKIAGQVNERIKNGEKIYNLTIGDFDPKIFPIPSQLKQLIIHHLSQDETNYPPADGVMDLRKSVSDLIKRSLDLDYQTDEILIGGGARPMIYSLYRTILDEGDKVIFSVPSWNNNHYSYLSSSQQIVIETKPQNNFMLSADDIRPFIKEATLLALCSPQNPTGTTISREGLKEICDLIISENKTRVGKKPLYLMYDQIYSELCLNDSHIDPVSVNPEMKNYTIFIDGVSKSLSATGIRVGWAFGPKLVINKMKSILSHVGAWAPKAEQLATADFINDVNSYDDFLKKQKEKISNKLNLLYNEITKLKNEGLPIDVVKPEGAIYLSVKIDILDTFTDSGKILKTTDDITTYLIEEAGIAIVPFSAFGSSKYSAWFRISIGTFNESDINDVIKRLKTSLQSVTQLIF
jgi:aspartate aminotransferase